MLEFLIDWLKICGLFIGIVTAICIFVVISENIVEKINKKFDNTLLSGIVSINDNAASGQKVVPVAATTNFSPGDRVIIGRGGAREEEGIIDTISAGY